MYRLTCDGLPLLDWRDNDLIVVNPKIRLEVNTVGEGSFTIYKNHPNYDSLKKLKSVLEVSDDNGVIFRGRATGDTIDFDHGMSVDMEGAMAYFNDSVVRPFNFPDDFQVSGDRVAFFLGWLIDNHNAQVQDFQKMKLGNVTVQDENFARSVSEFASTWEVLKAKLFDSSLGGYICIRYEEDGNYIDYLAEFTEANSQEIVFGENLLDLTNETEASETYSAIIPIGALGLTIESLEDGDITDDIVKSGDTIYSRKAVEEYGWIYAPTSATTWDEVTDETGLLTSGVEFLTGSGVFLNAMEATAVDLHFTDEQVESLRIYKNVNVRSGPHGVAESIPLAKLEIELLKPENTKIKVGKTIKTLTERTALQQEEAKKKYSKLSKTDEEIRLEVQDEINKLSASVDISLDNIRVELNGFIDEEEAQSLIDAALGKIELSVSSENGSTTFTLTDGDATLSTQTLNLAVDAVNVTGKLTADQIDATELKVDAANITGTLKLSQMASISFGDLSDADEVDTAISDAYDLAYDAYEMAGNSLSEEEVTTLITSTLVQAPTIKGGEFYDLNEQGRLTLTDDSSSYAWLTFESVDGSREIFSVGGTDHGGTRDITLMTFAGKTILQHYTSTDVVTLVNVEFAPVTLNYLADALADYMTVTAVFA